MMSDEMLTELYKRVFETKQQAERLNSDSDATQEENRDRLRQVAISKN